MRIIPLLAEEGRRDSCREARARQGEASIEVRPKCVAGLLLRLRPSGLALRATPSAPSLRSAQPLLRLRPSGLALRALLCEEGNNTRLSLIPTLTSPLAAFLSGIRDTSFPHRRGLRSPGCRTSLEIR